MGKPNFSKAGSPRTAPSVALTSPSSMGSNSILSEFSESISPQAQGLWSHELPLSSDSRQPSIASDNSVASVGASFEQSKFDLNGDDAYNDFYDEIRSKAGLRKAVRSMSLDPAACPTPLSIAPRQLAEIFAMFQDNEDDEDERARSKKPTNYVAVPTKAPPPPPPPPPPPSSSSNIQKPQENTDSDAATEVTSNTFTPSTVVCHPKIESLQRECEALKQIIGTDSAKMLQLQGEIKLLVERLDQAGTEKKQLLRQIRGLQLEREAGLRHQKTQEETIDRLTVELERVPSNRTCAGASFDLEELKLANELLASQVIEAERELGRANSDRDSDKENFPPPVTPDAQIVESDWGISTCLTDCEPSMPGNALSDITPQKLALQLEKLESRLKFLEDDALSKSTKSTVECSEIGIQCDDVDYEADKKPTGNPLQVPLEGDGIVGIEVGLDGTLSIVTFKQINKDEKQPPLRQEMTKKPKCSSELLCGCLAHKNDEGPQEV